MTVIATFAISDFPVIFGDLLITGPTPQQRTSVAVPAIGQVGDFFENSGWSITALQQKLTVIGDYCVLAWAGSWLGAKTAIAGLFDLSLTEPLTCDSILHYLQSNLDLQQHPASFVGLIAEGNGLRQFHFGADQLISPSLGNVYYSGSGSDSLKQFSDFFGSVQEDATGMTNTAIRSISGAVTLGAILLQSELHGGHSATTLLNMFGGGYEVGFFADGRMQKLDDLTYAFWTAEVSKSGIRLSPPQLLIKQKYLNDHLLIRSVKIEADASALRITEDQRHIIRPMIEVASKIRPEELASISLQSKWWCHCVMIIEDGRHSGIQTTIKFTQNESEASISIEEHEDRISLNANRELISQIMQSLDYFNG